MLMDSLNELGYQGPITAIAPANVQQKLALLLSDELNARVTWQTQTFDPDRPASDPRASGQPGTQGLVMVAASDRLDGDEEVAERFLNFLGVDRAIVLKPYAWGTSHRYLYSRPSPDSGVVVTDLEGSESPGNTIAPDALFNFHTPLLTHDELNDLIDRRVTASDVAGGLKEIVRAVHENGTEVMPVYGLHNVTESGRVSALSTLAAGISRSGIGKPSVILSFGRTTVDFAPVHTNAQLSRTDITAPDLREQLERLGPDDVLIVQSAGLPQDVFRQVFQLGTLPHGAGRRQHHQPDAVAGPPVLLRAHEPHPVRPARRGRCEPPRTGDQGHHPSQPVGAQGRKADERTADARVEGAPERSHGPVRGVGPAQERGRPRPDAGRVGAPQGGRSAERRRTQVGARGRRGRRRHDRGRRVHRPHSDHQQRAAGHASDPAG